MSERIVILGFLSHFPVAGVAWQTLHYLLGFERLGFEVYYVEAHGCTPSKLMRSATDDGPARAAEYIQQVLRPFGFDDRWAYHAPYPEPRYLGLSQQRLTELYRSAACVINLHGSHIPTPELTAGNRLVYLETDPVDVEIDLFHNRQETIDYLAPHCAFFTFGENLGKPDCLVPTPERFQFRATRQPVVMDLWQEVGTGRGEAFTTIGNWQQPWREVVFKGETYRWSKHLEFCKFLDLPRLVQRPFELALSFTSCRPEDRTALVGRGWRVVDALEFSSDLDAYRRYIGHSRGEFTVAKEQNIRLRSGWFSDRAVTYLAAGLPVITQETGFSNTYPTGEGLFAFSSMEEIIAAVESINADYERHRRAARSLAGDYFRAEVVLGRLLEDLGISLPRRQHAATLSACGQTQVEIPLLPPGLVLAPKGRWPTRLSDETIDAALALPLPKAHIQTTDSTGVSVVIVTHNGLAYTKMCLATLLGGAWNARDELIIVDNASTDGTSEYLRALTAANPFVQLITNSTNAGFAAANNQGLKAARGAVLLLLNNDVILLDGWRRKLLGALEDSSVGLVGPVTNRTCNEAQIDAPYRTYGELEQFARSLAEKHGDTVSELPMLAMFCLALRRDVFQRVGLLDEQFAVGMFEDDDYSLRIRETGLRILCLEGLFVHHFGQGAFGELCVTGEYDRIFAHNRALFEAKWNLSWEPHRRRITREYQELRERIKQAIAQRLPKAAAVAIISKGDEELLNLTAHCGWHFPQAKDGSYPNIYPADSTEAIAQLEALRLRGAQYLLIPKPAFWWLEYYGAFKTHLEQHYTLSVNDCDTCLVFDLGGAHG